MARPSPTILACAVVLAAASAQAAGVAKGPWVQHVGTTSAAIRVEVDPPGPVTVELQGPAGVDASATRTVAAGEKTTYHSIVVDGLVPATRYTYTVRAAGESRTAAFTTAPDKNVRFHFLVYGDNRTDDAAHAAVVRAMTSVKSDFLVNTGDFVEVGETPSEWQTFFDIEAPLLRERCLFACIGNHELIGGAGESFVKYFGPNEIASAAGPEQLQGTFRWGSARFFLVNGMVRYRSGPDRSWLDRVLAQSDGERDLVWRIVVIHHGPWSSGPHGDNRELWAAGVVDLFRQHKIDLVIAGHDHIYERGFADGMGYLVSGGGGAPPYRIKTPRASARKVESSRHFIDAAVDEAAIALTATRADGTTIERCALRKSAGWDCDGDSTPPPTASATAPVTSAASASTPAAAPTPASRCACRAAGLPTADRGSLVALLAIATAFLRRLRTR